MSIERPRGTAIAVGHRIVKDDQEPHIDPYGAAMIGVMCGWLETVLENANDEEDLRERLQKLLEYGESISDRYS